MLTKTIPIVLTRWKASEPYRKAWERNVKELERAHNRFRRKFRAACVSEDQFEEIWHNHVKEQLRRGQ